MKISLRWLNGYLDRPVDAAEADRLLTDAGFPLDGMEALDDGDALLDVEVTSNRPDCLSHVGVAREIAAASGRALRPPEAAGLEESGERPADAMTSVDLRAPELCPHYTARIITGVRIAPSPGWLARALEAVGLRPVNNVVDATNFVLHELGQPLHAFDLGRLAERRVVVRRADAGEPFTAIDGSKHELGRDMLVIADAARPVALAGVMGGLDSEVGAETTDILLESARFDPLAVRSAARALKLASDSSYRFERGVDPRGVDLAGRRAAGLILDLAGGALAPGVVSVGQDPPEPRSVALRPDRVAALLGFQPPIEKMLDFLDALGLSPERDGATIRCTVPTRRLDLEREVDLIEEVARLAGYGVIPVEERMSLRVRPPQPTVLARRRVGQVLTSHGYHETITFSFVDRAAAEGFAGRGESLIELADERRAAQALRPNLLPSLLAVRKTNQDAGNRGVKLFEVARAFGLEGGEGEGGGSIGEGGSRAYRETKDLGLLADVEDPASLRGLRGTIEELAEAMGAAIDVAPLEGEAAAAIAPWASTAGAIVDAADPDRRLGVLGRASAATLKRFDLKVEVDLAWLNYEGLTAGYPPPSRVEPLPRFPAIERDLSAVVDEAVTWRSIAETIRGVEPELMESVAFVTTYRGKQVGAGRKSVTLRMRFRDPAATLRHDEVDPQVSRVVEQLRAKLGAELRAS